jgi:hypothetical protein
MPPRKTQKTGYVFWTDLGTRNRKRPSKQRLKEDLMTRSLPAVLFAAALTAGVPLPRLAAADVGPKPLSYAGHPTPLRDMKGIEVEMAAEEVKLVLSKAKLEVDALFTMVNHGPDAEFEEGFPVGPYKTMPEFSITLDGKPAAFKLVDRNSSDPSADRSKEADPDYFGGKGRKGDKVADFWYVWTAAFKAGGRHTHQVRYTVSLAHQHFYHQTGYTLHTGAAWKNPIGKAVVTLTFGKDSSLHHLRGVSPFDAARYEADRVVWTFESFEPGKEHDILIRYDLDSWQDDLATARKDAAGSWYGRRVLAAQLKEVPLYQGRKKFTPAELQAWLDALASLISEAKVEEGKLVLPATDPERFSGPADFPNPMQGFVRYRYYVLESNPLETFQGFLDEALAAAREHPAEPKAKDVLRAYRDFLRHLAAGDLYLDYRPMAQNAKLAAERNIKLVGRVNPKEGKVVPADRIPDEKKKVLEAKLGEAEALLR